MKRLIRFVLLLMALSVILPGCSMSKKTYQELRGLMLLENTQIGRNRAYYSKQNIKKIKSAHRRLHKGDKYR